MFKIRTIADENEWKLFGVWCLVLVYLVPFVLLNLQQFLKVDMDKMFYGFNILLAFSGGYLGLTILCTFYLLVKVFILFVISFFETGDKKSKGYSRWMNEGELKKELKMKGSDTRYG